MSDERKTTVGTSRLHGLDFLRGVAILAVLTIHGSKSFPVDSQWINSALRVGSFGVHLFYLVSALTMCYMWELRSGELAPVRSFYIRRFFRIAPLFWLAIPACVLPAIFFKIASKMGKIRTIKLAEDETSFDLKFPPLLK